MQTLLAAAMLVPAIVDPAVLITHIPPGALRLATVVAASDAACVEAQELDNALRTRARFRVVYDPLCVPAGSTLQQALDSVAAKGLEADALLLVTAGNNGGYQVLFTSWGVSNVEQRFAWTPGADLAPGPFPADNALWTVPGCADGEPPEAAVQAAWLERETFMWPPIDPRPVHAVYQGRRTVIVGASLLALLEGDGAGQEFTREVEHKNAVGTGMVRAGWAALVAGFPTVLLSGVFTVLGTLLPVALLLGVNTLNEVPWQLVGGGAAAAFLLLTAGAVLFVGGFALFFGGLLVRVLGQDRLRVPVAMDQTRVDQGVVKANDALLDRVCGAADTVDVPAAPPSGHMEDDDTPAPRG